MSEWRRIKLGDIVTLNYGKALKKQDRKDGSIPVFSSAGHTGLHNEALADSEGIIVGRKGTVGKIYISNGPFWCIDTAYYILPNPTKYDFSFLFYLLKTLGLEELNEDSAVPGLNRDTAYSQYIVVPTIPEQKAIASVLSSLDDKIDLLHRQNKTLESMAETLFRQWFEVNKIECKKNKEVSFFGKIVCGKTPSKSNPLFFGSDIPFLKIPDMHNKVFVTNTSDGLSLIGANSQPQKMIPAGSITVSCIATVGLVCITGRDMQTNQQINSILPRKNYYTYFLYMIMKSLYDELHNLASGGTATLNLNTSDFSKMKILAPSDDKIKSFHLLVKNHFEKIKMNTKQIQTLEKFRDTLLSKLMSGEVRVKYTKE
jgi:type I restriction enzyme, S subunit